MIEYPVFKPHYHVEVVSGEGVFLLEEKEHKILTGELYELITPHINGEYSSDEICSILSTKISAAEVYYAINILEKNGFVVDRKTLNESKSIAFLTANGVEPQNAITSLKQKSVSIISFGNISTSYFSNLLKDNDVKVAEDGELVVVITDEYLRPEIGILSKKLIKQNKSWIIIKPIGIEILIGPLFSPQIKGCWKCLADRYALNRGVEKFVMEKQGLDQFFVSSKVFTSATLAIAYGIVVQEIVNWLTCTKTHKFSNKVLSLDTRTWEIKTHILTHRPQCTICGEVANSILRPIKLKNKKASFTNDGGHRETTPLETIKKYSHLVSPITGVVNLLERDTSLEDTVHVYAAGHNLAMRHDTLASLKIGLRSMSAGKGVSKAQAKASGLCEAIERNSGLFYGDEHRIFSSYAKLDKQAIHPHECLLFSDQQYANRKEINDKESKFNFIPERFDNLDLDIEWTPVWSLTNETFNYMLTQHMFYNYMHRNGKRDPVYTRACSNGAASGNSLEEAILQGFFELIERDAVALWWYNMLNYPGVDMESIDNAYYTKLVSYYYKMNRNIWIIDITSDLKVPTFVALSRRIDQEEERIIFSNSRSKPYCSLKTGI